MKAEELVSLRSFFSFSLHPSTFILAFLPCWTQYALDCQRAHFEEER